MDTIHIVLFFFEDPRHGGFFWTRPLGARHALHGPPRHFLSTQKHRGDSICIKNEVNRGTRSEVRANGLGSPYGGSSAGRGYLEIIGRRSSRCGETLSVLALTSLLITRFTAFLMQILSPRCFRVDREGRGGPWRPWRAPRGRVQKNPIETH